VGFTISIKAALIFAIGLAGLLSAFSKMRARAGFRAFALPDETVSRSSYLSLSVNSTM